MRNIIIASATLLVSIVLPGIAHADLNVVATVPDLAALTRELGGSHVHVTALSMHTQDPHFVDAKPSLVIKVNKADMLVAVGLDLEIGWLPTLQTGARNGKIQKGSAGYVDCSTFVRVLEVPKGKIDRSMGDLHPGGNPHYLYDPRAARMCASGISGRMIQLDPKNAGYYAQLASTFDKKIATKIAQWGARMRSHRGAPILTYHRSWSYLIDWLGLDRVANLEPKPGIAPSPKQLLHVIRLAKKKHVRLILEESYYPSRTGSLVARKIGAQMVRLEGGTNVRHGQTYIERMEALVSSLEASLH